MMNPTTICQMARGKGKTIPIKVRGCGRPNAGAQSFLVACMINDILTLSLHYYNKSYYPLPEQDTSTQHDVMFHDHLRNSKW